jgi:hypothetical protein
MTERFEIRLSTERKRELDDLAAEIGVSAADCARLAIHRLLSCRDLHLQPRDAERRDV